LSHSKDKTSETVSAGAAVYPLSFTSISTEFKPFFAAEWSQLTAGEIKSEWMTFGAGFKFGKFRVFYSQKTGGIDEKSGYLMYSEVW
jgi:hypothetical protein